MACQATVARTWLVTNPTVLRIARSRRRRRTDVSSVCAMIPQASSISTKARMSGRPLTPDRSRTSGGGTAGSTVPGNCCFRVLMAAGLSRGFRRLTRNTLRGIGNGLTARAPAIVITPPLPSSVCSLVISGDSTTSPVTRSVTGPCGPLATTVSPTFLPSARSSRPPSAISPGASGRRPASTGGTTRPVTVCRPTRVTSSRPSSCAPPMAVTVNPETNASARSRGTACALTSPECGLPTVTSQSQPASAGSPITCDTLDPNTSAASTAASAAAIPTIAARTGTAARPRPVSNASWIPDTAAGDRPRPASRPASPRPGTGGRRRERRSARARGAASAARPGEQQREHRGPAQHGRGVEREPR